MKKLMVLGTAMGAAILLTGCGTTGGSCCGSCKGSTALSLPTQSVQDCRVCDTSWSDPRLRDYVGPQTPPVTCGSDCENEG